MEGVSSAREDMTCELSSPGREGVGIPSEAEEGPREGARRRDRKPSAQDGGDFTVSQQDSRDTVRYHTPKRISKLYLFQRRAEDSKKGGLEDDGNTS